MPHHPLVVIVAGPNGAGKTTASCHLLQGALGVNDFVNADAIASGLSAFQPESIAIEAGRAMLARLRELADARADFAFETTLASRSFAPWLEKLKADGYRSHLTFVSLRTAELAVNRVALRVKTGGHHVPEETVRRRYAGGLKNFFDLYRGIVDSWEMYDNSSVSSPRLIAAGEAGLPEQIHEAAAWKHLQEVLR